MDMRYQSLPGTDLSLSVVGMGCWAIGRTYWGDDGEDEVSRSAIHAALDVGINWFDTAPLYGDGHADVVLRAALRGVEAETWIATKVGVMNPGPSGHAQSRLDAAHLRADLEASLRRLERECIDLLQVHWPCELGTPLEETFRTLGQLQSEGKIRYIGVCNYGPEALTELSAHARVVSLQTPYTLLRRELEGPLLDTARRLDMGVLAVYLTEQRVEGVLQSSIHPVPLRSSKLIKVSIDPSLRLVGAFTVASLQIANDFFTAQHRLGNLVRRHPGTIPPEAPCSALNISFRN